jgi:hypothetical protein
MGPWWGCGGVFAIFWRLTPFRGVVVGAINFLKLLPVASGNASTITSMLEQ